MSQDIHFEVHVRAKAAKTWRLIEAGLARAESIELAKERLGKEGVVGVRVTKETFNREDGTFNTVAIFEDGDLGKKVVEAEKKSLPCYKPQDLYSGHSRSVIARVLRPTLDEWQVTPMELGHRADLLEKLEAKSTALQHAVQQVAIATAAGNPKSIHEIFRQLMDLALRAMDRVAQDERKGKLKGFTKPTLAAFAQEHGKSPDFGYLLSVAIAKHLKRAKGFGSKLAELLELLDDLPADEETRTTSLETVDAYISELLRSPASLSELLGPCEDLGAALRLMTQIFLGRMEIEHGPRAKTLARLAAALSGGYLDGSKSALAERIIAEIKSVRRLHPSSFDQEVATMRHLAQRLVLGIGPHLTIEDVTEAFSLRSRRLVTPETINAFLESTPAPDERLERLIDLEENIVGAQSKRTLAAFIVPILKAPKTDSHFLDDKVPPLARLKRLTEIQSRLMRATFDARDGAEIAAALDSLAQRVEARAQLFRSIDQKAGTSADKAFALLRLKAHGVIGHGAVWERARTLILTYMRRPDFAATLIPDTMEPEAALARKGEFKRLFDLSGLGRKPETQGGPADEAA